MTDKHCVQVFMGIEPSFSVRCNCGFVRPWTAFWRARQSALIHCHMFDGTVPAFLAIEARNFLIQESP